MQPYLPQMIALLLWLTALRLGHKAVLGAFQTIRISIVAVLALQLGLPLAIWALASLAGVADTAWVLAAILATSAPLVTGAPNLALLLGVDAGAVMRIMVLGTALFPLTALPVLVLLPGIAPGIATFAAAGTLLAVICLAAGSGFAARALIWPDADAQQIKSFDGLAVLAFSLIVIALMGAVSPALLQDPATVALWMLLAFGINCGTQIVTYRLLPKAALRGPVALGAGNRNIALFLVALPAEATAPLLIFIGCWQFPMYLTPVLMHWLYRDMADE